MVGLKNQFKTVILLGLLTGILLWIGSFWGRQGMFIGLAFALIVNFGSYWFSDKLVLAMYKAKPIPKSHEIYRAVKEIAKEAGIPTPKVYAVPTMTPNAFATGRDYNHSAVAVTEGIVHVLNKEELKAVLAHEIGHIKNRDTLIATIAATIAGVISYLSFMARWAAIFGGGRSDRNGMLELLVLAILTPLLATIIRLAISRSREFLADASGAKFIKNPKALASALQKIEAGVKHIPMRGGNKTTASLFIINPFRGQAFIKLFSTHPPVKERVRRLEGMKV